MKRLATQPLSLRWGFETTSEQNFNLKLISSKKTLMIGGRFGAEACQGSKGSPADLPAAFRGAGFDFNGKKVMYSSDTKTCGRQIVRESLRQILAGTFQVPTLDEMESILEQNFDHTFDEYKVTRKIRRSHMDWGDEQVMDELERQKRHYENELRVNLRVAALNTIEEIENLIKSLNQAITEWKVLNL